MARPENYKENEYIHFIEKTVGEEWVGKGDKKRKVPKKERYEISFEEIEKLNLNKIGNEIPYTGTNVVNLERYMLYYWKHIMDSDCILLYLHLWEYCDRKNGVDICYPKMTELCQRLGMTKPTLISKIKKLEENNFLIQIHRLNKRNNNREDSPIYKLRSTIPLLTKEQYHKLPKLMKKKHDDYMERFANEQHMEWYGQTGNETIDMIIQNHGDLIISSKVRKEIKKSIHDAEAEEYIRKHLPKEIKHTFMSSEELIPYLIDNQYFSKPAAELYFKDIMVVYNERELTVYVITKNKEQKQFFEEVLIKERLERLLDSFAGLYESFYDFKCYTREQYIITILKGK